MALHHPASVHPDHHRPGSHAQCLCPAGFLPTQEVLHRGRDLLKQPGGRRRAAVVLSAVLGRQHMEWLQLAFRTVSVQSGQHGH